MSDFIKREDALKALREYPVTKLKTAIRRLPSADVAPVVRCKECKHWYNDGDAITWCNLSKWACGGNGFCLYAERKDNE